MTKIFYFYSVNNEYGCFSNFSPHPIIIDALLYPTVEHYFQSQKFTDKSFQTKIIMASTPLEASILGRNRHFPIRKGWNNLKGEIMLQAMRAKMEQHPRVRELLLSTSDAQLIDHSKNDISWGDKGKNRLGKLLMQVRDEYLSEIHQDKEQRLS